MDDKLRVIYLLKSNFQSLYNHLYSTSLKSSFMTRKRKWRPTFLSWIKSFSWLLTINYESFIFWGMIFNHFIIIYTKILDVLKIIFSDQKMKLTTYFSFLVYWIKSFNLLWTIYYKSFIITTSENVKVNIQTSNLIYNIVKSDVTTPKFTLIFVNNCVLTSTLTFSLKSWRWWTLERYLRRYDVSRRRQCLHHQKEFTLGF